MFSLLFPVMAIAQEATPVPAQEATPVPAQETFLTTPVHPLVNTIGARCTDNGHALLTQDECWAAAETLGLTAKFATNNIPRPEGCYRKGNRVYFGLEANAGNGASITRKPICKLTGAPVYPWIDEIGQRCTDIGHGMLTQFECFEAAEALGLTPKYATSHPDRPEGCYRKGVNVFFGEGPLSQGNGAQEERKPICKAEVAAAPVDAPVYDYENWGICISEGQQKFWVDPSAHPEDECAALCEDVGTPYFSVCDDCSAIPEQGTNCRCCASDYTHIPAGGWAIYEFDVEETDEPTVHYATGGVCFGSVFYTGYSLENASNKDQCAEHCLSLPEPTEFFASCEACGQPACRCCDQLNFASSAGGWSQYKFEYPTRRLEDESEE